MNSAADLLAADRYQRMKQVTSIGKASAQLPGKDKKPIAENVLAKQSVPNQKPVSLGEKVRVFEPSKIQHIIIKPRPSSWEALEQKLSHLINYPNLWITIRQRYEAGQGAELETAAEIALAKARINPIHMFATMVSKASGNWETLTLKMIHDTWEVRHNALEVIDRLKLPRDNIKAILALSWRLRGSIIHYLALATEQGTGIKNPIGVFFASTKQPKPKPT